MLCGTWQVFRDFVCTYYMRPEAFREVQEELRNVGKKDLSVKEVWQELRRLFMSHDAKAKRQGYPELTDQQKVEYLIDGLRPRVQFLMSWLRRQRHPDLATPSMAYAAALLCEKDFQKLDIVEQGTAADLAWFTPANAREQVRLPLPNRLSSGEIPKRETISSSERVPSRIPLLRPRLSNPQLIESMSQRNSSSSSAMRRKRTLDDDIHRQGILCAFCYRQGHSAVECRKRR